MAGPLRRSYGQLSTASRASWATGRSGGSTVLITFSSSDLQIATGYSQILSDLTMANPDAQRLGNVAVARA